MARKSTGAVNSHDIRHRLAANIRRSREALGLSQERLAFEAGIDRTMLSKIERRLSNPSLDTLLKLAERLDLDITDLLAPTAGAAPTPHPVPVSPLNHAGPDHTRAN